MTYLIKFMLIGSLVSLGLLAAQCQDFLGLVCQDWFSRLFRRKQTKRSAQQGHASTHVRRTRAPKVPAEVLLNPFEPSTSLQRHRKTGAGRRRPS